MQTNIVKKSYNFHKNKAILFHTNGYSPFTAICSIILFHMYIISVYMMDAEEV